MVPIITFLIPLAAIIVAVFNPLWAFYLLIARALWLLYVYWSAKTIRLKPISELSAKANELLIRYSHYYYSPLTAQQYSGAVSRVIITSNIVTIIACLHRFWWGIAIGIGLFLVMGPFQRAFSPKNFMAGEEELKAHEEIMNYLTRCTTDEWLAFIHGERM
jgi:hypothetical protein